MLLLKQGLELLLVELIEEVFAENGHLDEVLSLVRSCACYARATGAYLLLEWLLGLNGRLAWMLEASLGISSKLWDTRLAHNP